MDMTRIFTENDWSNTDTGNVNNYVKSKTFAEKAAWDFVHNESWFFILLRTVCKFTTPKTVHSQIELETFALKKLHLCYAAYNCRIIKFKLPMISC